jgi:hypothetical protein
MVARLYEVGFKLHLRLIHPTISTANPNTRCVQNTNTRCVQNTKNQMVSLFCVSIGGPHLSRLEHDEWWASQAKLHTGEYDWMSVATRTYKKRALESLNNNLFLRAPGSARAKYLWINDDYDGSISAHMFELTAEPGSLPEFEDMCDLLMYATSPPASARPCRRIIIVEDIGQRCAEML